MSAPARRKYRPKSRCVPRSGRICEKNRSACQRQALRFLFCQFRKSFSFLLRLGWRVGVAGFASLASGRGRKLAHSAAPTLPMKAILSWGTPKLRLHGLRICALCQFRKSFSFLLRLG